MTETTKNNADTTYLIDKFDVFSDAMNSIRISGSLLLNEDYLAPWGIQIPSADRLKSVIKADKNTQVIAFHCVKRGYLELAQEGKKTLAIEAGEMVICFGGQPHLLLQGTDLPAAAAQAVSAETLLGGGKNPFQPEPHQKARSTSLLCGLFMMRNLELNPLFASLPPLLHLSAQKRSPHNGGQFNQLSHLLGWITEEADAMKLGSGFVLERLLEILCAEALRAHFDTHQGDSAWLTGLKDPVVGRAIRMIHAQPGNNWTVQRLAQGVAMSPSRFAARFTQALGQSPMVYVTQWRMNQAGRLLCESLLGIHAIAGHLGYENVAAFTRAFKRHLGAPPAAWRASRV